MKRYALLFIPIFGTLFIGCQSSNKDKDDSVVSERYLHKFGYDVSKEEWESTGYPGQVVTILRNGVTITASYENSVLHGPYTCTFPHSNTKKTHCIYDKGNLIKKTTYDLRGIPKKEQVFLSPTHLKVTQWFNSGVPLSIEEFHNTELLEGKYYNEHNETEHRVTNGSGTRISRDDHEKVIKKETVENGYTVLVETYHSHGIPHTIVPLSGGNIHGVKKVFSRTGEPISKENYSNNILHGLATYYQNGCRYLEITYKNGMKEGIERHFIDGQTVTEETEWFEGQKHGPSIVYFDGLSNTRYHYNNQSVTKERYRELCQQEENIAIMHDRAREKN